MKEFIEKLIGRLEEHEQYEMEYGNYHASFAYGRTIEIVNELAEEYKVGFQYQRDCQKNH